MVTDFREKIQRLLAAPDYHPLRRSELARKLQVAGSDRVRFRRALDELLQKGEIARVRKDRYVLPREADLVAGRIQFSEKGFAFVVPDRPDTPATPAPQPDIYVGEEDTGVALHGDQVLVRLNRERRSFRGGDKPSGRVIRILERAHDPIVGTLQKSRYFHYVIPDDPRIIHDLYVKPALNAQVGYKVVARLTGWTSRHVNPEGEIIEVLGRADQPGVDILAIIRKHRLPTEFTEPTLAEADRLPEAVPAADLTGRLDLRENFIVTIDPDDAKDFDDAIQVDELPDGGWRLGVHIADVSHYVPVGSALDREAHGRGNSVYLVDRVLPMLPEKLSNNLCSLRPRQDRLTESVFIEFTDQLAVRKVEFALSVIHSRHRLTYREAFALLTTGKFPEAGTAPKPEAAMDPDSIAAPSSRKSVGRLPRGAVPISNRDRPPGLEEIRELAGQLQKMWRLASRLRRERMAHGSLDLNFPETKVRCDSRGRPVRIERVEYDISHQLIEEFMLAANEAVAREICQRQIPLLYRIHEDPDLDKLRDFRVYAQSFGYKVGDVAHRRELQKLLATVTGKPEAYAINLALLRSLKQARYSPQPVGHYGLAKKFYTHFTSPIRRYADLVVHRTLRALIAGGRESRGFGAGLPTAPSPTTERSPLLGDGGDLRSRRGRGHESLAQPQPGPDPGGHRYSLPELSRIAEHVSRTERVADEAEKESVELKKLEYFQNQLESGAADRFDAVICGVRNFGIFVELPETLVQGLVHISTIDDDFYRYDPQRERLVGNRTKRILRIGDKLHVRVERVDLFKRQIDFRIV